MTESRILPPPTLADVIAADSYWASLPMLSQVGMRFPPTNVYRTNKHRHFREAIKRVADADIDVIEEGRRLPRLALPDGILKLVVDEVRTEWIRHNLAGKFIYKIANKIEYFPGVQASDGTEFEAMAQRMAEEPFYTGPAVMLRQKFLEGTDVVVQDVSRRVVYASNVGSSQNRDGLTYDWLVGYGSLSMGVRNIGKQVLDIAVGDEEYMFGKVGSATMNNPNTTSFSGVSVREKLVEAVSIRFTGNE